MTNERDELVTVKQAAMIKRVDESSIRRAVRDGRLKGQNLSGVYVMRRGDVYDWTPERRGRKRKDAEETPDNRARPHLLQTGGAFTTA